MDLINYFKINLEFDRQGHLKIVELLLSQKSIEINCKDI